MENLKIIIGKNKDLAREVKQLIKELGFYISSDDRSNYYGWVIKESGGNYINNVLMFDRNPSKLVTVNQLRDMVVLKRNELKPIEKEMKEYLEPLPNGNYVLVKSGKPFHSSWIEVPEGSEFSTGFGDDLIFRKNGAYFEAGEWHESYVTINLLDGLKVSWQRETLNDKVASAEVARQDNVNHPKHYAGNGIECIDAIQSSMTKEAFCGYLKGNVQKYMWRYESKGHVESLKKAQWYLNKLIEIEAL